MMKNEAQYRKIYLALRNMNAMYLCTCIPVYLYTCIPVYLYTCIPVYLCTCLHLTP